MLHNLTDSDNPSNNQRGTDKESRGNTIVHRFLQGIRFHIQRKDRANTTCIVVFALSFLCVGLENVTAVIMLYKSTKAMVHPPDGDTNLFDTVAEVLPGDTYICLYSA